MGHEIQIFKFEKSQVRTVLKDGEPWFVAKDVADVLGYTWQGSKTVKHIPEEWRGVYSVSTPRGKHDVVIISEQGLYFFLARSDKPAALPLQRWVAGQVLPEIRKTGSYGVDPMLALNDPAALRGLLGNYAEMVIKKDAEIKALSPKAAVAERIAAADGLHSFREVAKILSVNERKLKKWLIENEWIHLKGARMMGMAAKCRAGYIFHKDKLITNAEGEDKSVTEMYFSPKGLARLTAIFNAHPNLDFSFAAGR